MTRFRNISIRKKILVSMLAFTLIPILLVSIVAITITYKTMRDQLFYPQLGVKLCSMAGGGVQKIYMVFLREPSRGTGQAVTCSTSGMGLRLK